MLVLRERTSYFLMAQRLDRKTADLTIKAGLNLFRKLPANSRHSTTFDNGLAFCQHRLLTKKLGMKTYFCDPYASWQKGGVENTNGRLRRDLPRKTDIHAMTQEAFDAIIWNYNTTPRQELGWKTPLEVFTENLREAA